jgi:hypothetical protein
VPTAYTLRQRCSVFGYNAPRWDGMPQSFRDDYRDGIAKGDPEWPDFVISAASGFAVDLDGSHPDIVEDSWSCSPSRATASSAGRHRLRAHTGRVRDLRQGHAARAEGRRALRVLRRPGPEPHGVRLSEPLTLVEEPDESDVQDDTIEVDGDVTAMKPGRTLIVRGTTTGERTTPRTSS